jgi:hypothetical protein
VLRSRLAGATIRGVPIVVVRKPAAQRSAQNHNSAICASESAERRFTGTPSVATANRGRGISERYTAKRPIVMTIARMMK